MAIESTIVVIAAEAFPQVHFIIPGSEMYWARRSREEAETMRCSLLREPIAAVMGWVTAFPPLRIELGFTVTLAVLGACCTPLVEAGPLLLSICVRMSLVYFSRFVIS